MSESTKGLPIDENLRDDIDSLVSSESHHFRNDGGGSEFDEDDVVESDSVERVLEGHTSLNLVSLDHGFEDVLHRERFSSSGKVIGNGQDSSEVVRRVTPFSSEEAYPVVVSESAEMIELAKSPAQTHNCEFREQGQFRSQLSRNRRMVLTR